MTAVASRNRAGTDDTGAAGLYCCRQVNLLRRVFPVILVYGLAVGLPFTLYPNLQSETFGNDAFMWSGIFGGIQGLLAMVYGPTMGSLSDKYGRRPTLLIALALYIVPCLSMAVTTNFWVFSVFNSTLGFMSGIYSVILPLVTDMIPEASGERPEAFSVMMGMLLIGLAGGPVVGTYTGSPLAFQIAAGVQVCNVILAYFIIPSDGGKWSKENLYFSCRDDVEEGTDGEGRGPGEDGGMGKGVATPRTPLTQGSPRTAGVKPKAADHPLNVGEGEEGTATAGAAAVSSRQDTKTVLNVADNTTTAEGHVEPKFGPRRVVALLRSNFNIRWTLLIIFINSLADQAIQNLLMLFLQRQLNFTAQDQLKFFGVFGVCSILCVFVLVGVLKKYLGTLRTMQLALLFNAIGISCYCLVDQKWQAYCIALTTMVSIAGYPTASAVIAGCIEGPEAGLGQGLGAGTRMLAEGVSPFLFGILLNACQDTSFPGAPFLVAGLLCLVSLGLTGVLRLPVTLTTPERHL